MIASSLSASHFSISCFRGVSLSGVSVPSMNLISWPEACAWEKSKFELVRCTITGKFARLVVETFPVNVSFLLYDHAENSVTIDVFHFGLPSAELHASTWLFAGAFEMSSFASVIEPSGRTMYRFGYDTRTYTLPLLSTLRPLHVAVSSPIA